MSSIDVTKCDEAEEVKERKKKQKVKSDLRFTFWFLLIFFSIRFFVFDYFIIPSSSMVPSLLIGDMPLVEKWTYGYSKHSIWFSPGLFSGRVYCSRIPARGEVIVFKAPEDNSTNVIKRVIGLPGDRVQLKNGVIHVNGLAADLKFTKDFVYYDDARKTYHNLKLYEEILPYDDEKRVHTVAYDPRYYDSVVNNTDEIVVPEDHFFVMGDNRDCSKDSRCGLGFVPLENVMGRAIRTIYSIGGCVRLWEFWLWLQNIRFDRIFKEIV